MPPYGQQPGRIGAMVRRALTVLVVACGLALVPALDAAFSAALPLADSIKAAEFILTTKVELVDADKPGIILVADEDLKGKFPARRLLVNMTGDDDAKKHDHRPQIFKRLAPKLTVILFISEIENTLVAFAFTNGTWFQMIAPKKL